MRNVALAVGGALLITAGIVLAAFRPTSTGDTEGVIGPAVVVGSPAPASSAHARAAGDPVHHGHPVHHDHTAHRHAQPDPGQPSQRRPRPPGFTVARSAGHR